VGIFSRVDRHGRGEGRKAGRTGPQVQNHGRSLVRGDHGGSGKSLDGRQVAGIPD
jgi:hypothetical protein